MKNSDYPAMPLSGYAYQDFVGYNPDKNGSSYNPECQGLTKREMFAMHAMQGLLSSESEEYQFRTPHNFAITAIELADALLEELSK